MYQFLSEEPQKDNLKFGHDGLLKTLSSIVRDCKTPFTIGLYGKWGSGKSSIAEGLKIRLADSGIPVILFDVWKHEGDALRRTFLKEITRQLQVKPYGGEFFNADFKLSERIDGALEKKRVNRIYLDFRTLLPFIKKSVIFIGAVILTLLLMSLVLTKYLPNYAEGYKSFVNENFFSTTIIISIIGWVSSNLMDFVSKSEISVNQNRITDPHDFESEFSRILDNLTNKRIIIVFDNLDRVSGEIALQTISTIKTFLEPVDRAHDKDVVFLVPCDVDAIKEHLGRVLRHENVTEGQPEAYADEFLRKFFNTIIWIPEFYSIELESFALEKLRETKIQEFNNDHLSWLIVQVFKQNPRQIIQFINVLIANYLLLESKSESGAFGDLEFHKRNVPQLAKFLLLIQKFPKVMEVYKAAKIYDLNTELIHTSESDFHRFREDTSDIQIESLEPFFSFKISDQEKRIPGISGLFQLIENGKIEEAQDYFRKKEFVNNIADLGLTINNFLGSKNNSLLLYTCLNGIFLITKELAFSLPVNTYREIQKKIDVSDKTGLEKILPSVMISEFLVKGIQILSSRVRTDVINKWIDILKLKHRNSITNLSRDYEIDLVKGILDNEAHIKENGRHLVEQEFTLAYSNDVEIWGIIVSHPNHKRFVTREVPNKIMESLVVGDKIDYEKFDEKIKLLGQIETSINDTVPGEFVVPRIVVILNLEKLNETNNIQKDRVLTGILTLIKLYPQSFRILPVQYMNSLVGTINNVFPLSSYKFSHFYLPILVQLCKLDIEPLSNIARERIKDFFSHLEKLNLVDIEHALSRTENIDVEIDHKDNLRHVDGIVSNSLEHFRIFYKYASGGRRNIWLRNLISGGRADWVRSEAEMINLLGINDPQVILNQFVSYLQSVENPKLFKSAVEALSVLSINPVEVDRGNLRLLIINSVKANRFQEQTVELYRNTKYFDTEDRLIVCDGVLEVLTKTPINETGLQIIESSHGVLTNEREVAVAEMVLTSLILNSKDDEWIDRGFQVVHQLGVKAEKLSVVLGQISQLANGLKDQQQGKSEKLLAGLKLVGASA